MSSQPPGEAPRPCSIPDMVSIGGVHFWADQLGEGDETVQDVLGLWCLTRSELRAWLSHQNNQEGSGARAAVRASSHHGDAPAAYPREIRPWPLKRSVEQQQADATSGPPEGTTAAGVVMTGLFGG